MAEYAPDLSETCGVCAWSELDAFNRAQHSGTFDPVPPEHDCADYQPQEPTP